MKFKSFYINRPNPVGTKLDIETKFVDQSEADRSSLKFQLERYGMDSLLQQFEKTKAQFGYADTRLVPSFEDLQNKMAEANSYFMNLPSRIRAKFNHSATEFFTSIENNPTKAYEDGYISIDLAKKLGVKFNDDITNNIPVSNPIDTGAGVVEPVEKTENVSV